MLLLLSVDAAVLLEDTMLILWSGGEECGSCKEKGVAGQQRSNVSGLKTKQEYYGIDQYWVLLDIKKQ
jgi:hypothetical protein